MAFELRVPPMADDAQWMQAALQQAREAAVHGEVPVGAVVVHQGQVIGRGFNQPVGLHDPSAHAEIQALRAAAIHLGNYRLDGCTLYVTLEPCVMCAGAILHARLDRVVWGAAEPRTGAAGSVLDVFAQTALNHHTATTAGVEADAAAALLTQFFAQRREVQQAAAKAAHPLRDDALRAPEKCFSACCDCASSSYFYSDWPALAGMRLHAKDSGAATTGITWLMLPGSPAQQGLFRYLAAGLQSRGDRVVALDWLGFGRSDKPKKESALDDARHVAVLHDAIKRLQLAQPLVLVAHGDASRLAISVVAQGSGSVQAALWLVNPLLPGQVSPAYREWLQLVARKPMQDVAQAARTSAAAGLSPDEGVQWQAQFPDKGFRAGLRAWARDAQAWADGAQPLPHRWPVPTLVSWGTAAQWWPECAVPEGGQQHRCSGGDWLPLQNPDALLQAAAFFRTGGSGGSR